VSALWRRRMTEEEFEKKTVMEAARLWAELIIKHGKHYIKIFETPPRDQVLYNQRFMTREKSVSLFDEYPHYLTWTISHSNSGSS